MRKITYAFVAGAAVLVTGCKDTTAVRPADLPTAEQLTGPLLKSGLQTLATGVIAADRAVWAGTGSAYPIIADIYARDFYRIDSSEPRYVNETLGGTADPGSFAGGGGWGGPYTAIRATQSLLTALKTPAPGALTATEISAAQGFAHTFKALDFYRVIELRDTVGVALQNEDPSNLAPAPLVCKTKGLDLVAATLDTALTELAAGGSNFPFTLPPGFASTTVAGRSYSSIANFTRFVQGLHGKVDFYRALDHQAPKPALIQTAITELTAALGGAAPGAYPTANFTFGPYHVFVPSGTEAVANPYSDSKVRLNPQVKDSILAGDTRSSKLFTTTTLSGQGISSNVTFTGSRSSTANQSRPISLLRDEEIVLLRAQAYFEAGMFTEGYADLNSVHTFYGNAAWPVSTNLQVARDNVLYDKRYSLLGEGVQRLVDLRAYSRLNGTYFAKALPNDPFNAALPIPKAEADARGGRQNLTPSCS